MTMTNLEIAKSLRLLADLLEIGGEPVFRVSAYRKADWPPFASVGNSPISRG
jgi:DNA polymerase/3'-5' exonuclease PolX